MGGKRKRAIPHGRSRGREICPEIRVKKKKALLERKKKEGKPSETARSSSVAEGKRDNDHIIAKKGGRRSRKTSSPGRYSRNLREGKDFRRKKKEDFLPMAERTGAGRGGKKKKRRKSSPSLQGRITNAGMKKTNEMAKELTS